MKRQGHLLLLTLTCLMSATWLGASPLASAAKTFVYCSEGSPSTFNPQLATDGPTFNASSRTVYNRLVDFKKGTTEVAPSLAESWTISKDAKTYTFKLRKNVPFQKTSSFKPSRPFNADDVVFSFNRQRLKDHPYHKVGGGTYEYFFSMEMDKIIKDVKKIDDHTVRFVLTRPEAPFLANLAMDFASILSAEYADQLLKKKQPEKLDSEPVGTGPFVFQRYAKDSMIRYKAHKEYFAGAPKVDRLVFAITTSPSVRYQKLKAGECHLIAEPAPEDVQSMKKQTQVALLKQPGLNVGYLAMNTQKKPFNKVLVRQAIHHALNRDAYIEAIYLGKAEKAKGPVPPTMWGYAKNLKDYEYSTAKAKKLLAKAGYPKGFETELWTLPVSRPYNPKGKKMGEMIQADLAKIGIRVKLVTYDWPTYLDKSSRGEHQMIQLGWSSDNGDPDNFLNVLLGCAAVEAGSNVARWCYKPFNQLVQKAKLTTNMNKRIDYYLQAQKIFKEQVPWIPIAHSIVFRGVSKKVKGYQIEPIGTESFEDVTIQ